MGRVSIAVPAYRPNPATRDGREYLDLQDRYLRLSEELERLRRLRGSCRCCWCPGCVAARRSKPEIFTLIYATSYNQAREAAHMGKLVAGDWAHFKDFEQTRALKIFRVWLVNNFRDRPGWSRMKNMLAVSFPSGIEIEEKHFVVPKR